MKRRSFIAFASAAGISTCLPTLSACRSEGTGGLPNQKVSDYIDMPVAEMQQLMKNGKLSARQLTQYYLKRIETIDKQGPALAAVIEINPDALQIADALDKERKAGKIRGPMHGIPVLIKDNIDTADQMQTTAGSIAMEGNIASQDAFVVKKLRDAGAVIIGKTNLSEWANFRSTRSSSGWSSRGGQTKNPYVTDRSPCGSSSGSGVAVSANLCAVAVGTETNGSIACPASMNGVVGIKPTVGLVSRSGIIPISKTQDTAGPLARTVADAALLLSVMSGKDESDAPRFQPEKPLPTDYTKFLNRDGLKGKRIGIDRSLLKRHEGVDQLLKKALDQIKAAGAEIVELDYMQKINIGNAESNLLRFEFKDGLNKYMQTAHAKPKSLADLIAYNKAHEAEAMPYFKQELFEESEAKGDLNSKDYLEALKKINGVGELLDGEFRKNKLDAICGPATGAPWCIDPVNGDFWTGYGTYSPAAMAGFPSITVPMGNLNELPLGLSFLAKAYEEPQLITIGFAYEQVSKNRVAPRFIETVGKQA